jgi:hypothetical protein
MTGSAPAERRRGKKTTSSKSYRGHIDGVTSFRVLLAEGQSDGLRLAGWRRVPRL